MLFIGDFLLIGEEIKVQNVFPFFVSFFTARANEVDSSKVTRRKTREI